MLSLGPATMLGSLRLARRHRTGCRYLAALRALVLVLLVGTLVSIAPASAQERGVFQDGESAEDIIDDAKVNQLSFVFQEIASATNDGLENLIPILNVLLASLLIISLVLTFMFGAFQEDFNPLLTLLKKAIAVGFILFFIQEWKGLRDALLEGAAQIGLISGNSDLAPGAVLNPANVAGRGFTLALAVITRVVDLSGPIAFFNNLAAIFVYLLAGVIIMIAFFILSITVFVALVEFYIGTTVALILFPLGVLRATSFAAQSAFGYVIASAVKIIVLGLIIGLATSIFIDPLLDQDPDPLQGEALGIAFISLAIAVVAWSASSLAAGLVQGGPALGAGAAVGPAVSAAAGGVAIGAGALAGAKTLGGLAGRAGGSAAGGAISGGGGGGPALSGPGGRPALGGPSGGGAIALPKPKVAGLLPPPSGGSGSASSSGGPLGSSGGSSPNLPAIASQSLPARAGQSLPATAGHSLPATAGHAPTMSAGGGGSGTGAGGGSSAGGGASAARAYMAKPAPPPAGEGNGGRGNGRGLGMAGAYAAQQAVMSDRGGGGYRGPDLERD